MVQSRSVGSVERLPGAESNIELDLQDSHFQLPIRHHPAGYTDGSREHRDTGLTGSELRNGYSQKSRQSLLFSDRATTFDARSGTSELEESLLARPSDSIFELLVRGDIAMVEKSLNNGLCLESLNWDGLTLLVVAIKESNIAMTELLLQNGADVHHRALGKPPLMYAIQSRRHGPQLIRLLLDHGANINTTCGSQHMNALHSAAATGMLDAVDYLIARGLGIESTCSRAHTPLHIAAGTGQMKVARLLLAQGAQMSLKSELGGNALVFAACNGHLDLVKLFLEEGLAVDDCDKTGLTALIGAVDLGHTHVVNYLLSKGADVDKADTKSNTPAMKAAAKGQTDTLQALISRGANLQKQNVEGENVLEIAISNGHHDTIRLILQTLGGTNYPLTSVSLEIASARKLETMRSLMKTASIMYAHMKPKSEILGEYAWMEWVLRTGGILVKPKAMFNMMNIAISDGHLALVEALLENGADPNMYLWSGTLPLNIAVVNGDLEVVKLLLDHGADPVVSANIVKRPSGPTKDVLLDALSNMKYDKETCLAILEELLRSGRFNILFGSASNQTAFWKVLESNHWDKELRDQILRMMLDTVSDVNYSCCGDGATLMHHVVRFGEKALVDVLLEKGASMNSRDNERRTPIMIACHFQPTMITYLLERGADLSLRYSDGKGPLHSAVTGGSLEALKALTTLDHGLGNLEQISKEGWTPLAYALAAGHEEAALFLIEQGANLNHTVGKFGRSMLHFAAAFSHEVVFDKIMALSHESVHTRDTVKDATPLLLACAGTRYRPGSSRIVRILLASGADIEAHGNNFDRPLHVAILTCNTNIAATLVEHGADVTATGSKGCTPLHLTAEYYNPDIMRLLLQKGVATELVDEDGWTPLDLCTAPLTAQILIDHGADIDHVDKKGLTILHRAVIYEDIELFRTLLKNGASTQVRATSDGLTVLERIEDLAAYRLRERFLAIVEDVVPYNSKSIRN